MDHSFLASSLLINLCSYISLVNWLIEHVQKVKETGGKKRRRGGGDNDDDNENDVENYLRLKTGKNGKMFQNGKMSKKSKRK